MIFSLCNFTDWKLDNTMFQDQQSRLVERVNVTGTAGVRPRSGASCVTSIRQDNMIRQRHLRDRFLTA